MLSELLILNMCHNLFPVNPFVYFSTNILIFLKPNPSEAIATDGFNFFSITFPDLFHQHLHQWWFLLPEAWRDILRVARPSD